MIFFPTAYFTSSLLCKVFFSSCDPSYESFFSVSNLCSVFLPCAHYFTILLSLFFVHSCISPHFFPFHISSSYISFFPLCVILFISSPALSFLISHFCQLSNSTFLLTFLLQAVLLLPLHLHVFCLNIFMYTYISTSFTLQLKTRSYSC